MNSYSLLALIIILYTLSLTLCRRNVFSLTRDRSTVLKGILSLLIILSHTNFHTDIPVFKTITNWGGTKVALFFFLSGYGLISSYLRVGSGYMDGFLVKRIWKIVKPLLVITLVYLGVVFLDKKTFPSDIIGALFLQGKTPLPYSWFVYVIILAYIIFFFVFRLQINVERKIAFVFIGLLLVSLGLYKLGFDRAWWVSNLAFPTGLVYGVYEEKLLSFSRQKYINLFLVPVCVLLAGVFVVPKIEFLYLFSYVFIAIFLFLLISYVKLPNGKVWHFLGNVSYETYLLHGALFSMLRGNTIFITNDYIYLLATIGCTLLFAFLFNQLFNKKWIK